MKYLLNAYSIDSEIFAGDHVLDRMDNTIRTISHFGEIDGSDATVFMTDGGCMGIKEIDFGDVFLGTRYPSADDVQAMIDDGNAQYKSYQ